MISGAALSFYKNKLTLSAALVAILVGFFVYCGGGLTALAMLVAFFISGTWATRHQWTKKEQLKLTEKDQAQETQCRWLPMAVLLLHLLP